MPMFWRIALNRRLCAHPPKGLKGESKAVGLEVWLTALWIGVAVLSTRRAPDRLAPPRPALGWLAEGRAVGVPGSRSSRTPIAQMKPSNSRATALATLQAGPA